MSAAMMKKLRSMDGAELRFRATAAVKARVDRARTALVGEPWRRESLRLSDTAPAAVRSALARRDWMSAHVAFSAHLVSRRAAFPLDPGRLSALAQTKISYHNNKYKPQDDVKLGRQAAAEVERQMPILRDEVAKWGKVIRAANVKIES